MLTFGGFLAAIESERPSGSGSLALDAPFTPSTDSRTLRPGDAFVCLRGPRFDGHDYIAAAIASGASAIVADDASKVETSAADDASKVKTSAPVPVIMVNDAKRAYMLGAAAARRTSECTVIGVTGSAGKTTVTQMCAQLLAPHQTIAVTPQNENNELGVSKLCYGITPAVQIAIVEMGARGPGQIAELVEIALPDIGVLTNVGEAHLEFFEDRAQLARTKFALFGKGARPVLNAADEWSRTLSAEHGVDRQALWIRLCGDPDAAGLCLEAGAPAQGRVPLTFGASHAFAPWHLLGEHHLRDALLAAGAAVLAGIDFTRIAEALGALRLPPGRFEMHRMPSGAVVIYDAYNASPTSVAHALRAFAELPAKRRIAILGSMAELGADAQAQHRSTGAAAARSGIDTLYCGGEFAQALASGALEAGMASSSVHTYAGNAAIAVLLRDTLADGDAVLLKGSRVQKMEEILGALVAQEAAAS